MFITLAIAAALALLFIMQLLASANNGRKYKGFKIPPGEKKIHRKMGFFQFCIDFLCV